MVESGVRKRLFATKTRAHSSHKAIAIANDTHHRKTDGQKVGQELWSSRCEGELSLFSGMVISNQVLQRRKMQLRFLPRLRSDNAAAGATLTPDTSIFNSVFNRPRVANRVSA